MQNLPVKLPVANSQPASRQEELELTETFAQISRAGKRPSSNRIARRLYGRTPRPTCASEQGWISPLWHLTTSSVSAAPAILTTSRPVIAPAKQYLPSRPDE